MIVGVQLTDYHHKKHWKPRVSLRLGRFTNLVGVYESGIPVFGTRHYSLRIPQMSGPLGENKTTWFEEIFSGEIGQIGTQFDGIGDT